MKAKISLPDGVIVNLDGTPKEVLDWTNEYRKTILPNTEEKNINDSIKGPQDRIRILISDNFFVEKRLIGDIQQMLEEKGFIYNTTHLSTPLKRLVGSGELRRIKDKKGWVYINP